MNATAQPTIEATNYNGGVSPPYVGEFDVEKHYIDGLSLHASNGSNPITNSDPLGLNFEDGEPGFDGSGVRMSILDSIYGFVGHVVERNAEVEMLAEYLAEDQMLFDFALEEFEFNQVERSRWMTSGPLSAGVGWLVAEAAMNWDNSEQYLIEFAIAADEFTSAMLGPSGLPVDFNAGPTDNSVYVLYDTNTGKPFYVGITKQNIKTRLAQHRTQLGPRVEIFELGGGYTRKQARAIEQEIISTKAGSLGNRARFLNKINSISKRSGWLNAGRKWAKAHKVKVPSRIRVRR